MAGGAFKSQGRLPRQIVAEESYARGMQYTIAPLTEGSCRAMVNFDLKDMGQVLVPRAGWRTMLSRRGDTVSHPVATALHHSGQALVTNTVTDEDRSVNYTLVLEDPALEYTDFADGYTLVEQEFSSDPNGRHLMANIPHSIAAGDVAEIRRKRRARIDTLHNTLLNTPDTFQSRKYLPVYALLNGTAILPVRYTPSGQAAKLGLARMQLKTDNGETLYNHIEYISPKVITPTEAINYGYNMLASAPYTFSDIATAAGALLLEGILPYADAACTDLKFNAKVGERITFRLFAQYPNTTTEYKFRWEIREIGTDNVTVYEDQIISANYYKFNGTKVSNLGVSPNTDFVKLSIQPPYKQFSVTVTAYDKLDLTEPVAVVALASYSLASDSKASTDNITPRSYPLHTANDMCVWKQRVVLWGVESAPNMLFVSDINDPSYFPYPNNAEIFDEAVIACAPYLGSLLVFTETKIHKLRWSEDGLSFVSEIVQERLSLTPFDCETVTLVQNLVYFKNGSYFYMIVPRPISASQQSIGGLQLAPISTPITYMLDHFQDSVRTLLYNLYNPEDPTFFPRRADGATYDLRLQDYHNYLDGSTVRNVYKYDFVVLDSNGAVSDILLRFDFLLNYNTADRTWTTYIVQSNPQRIVPYRQSVTDTTVYVNVRSIENPVAPDTFDSYIEFIKPDTTNRQDSFALDQDTVVKDRLLKNHQLLDTGNRDQNANYKKRYREIQFRLNTPEQLALQFGTAFIVDDQIRKDLFEYEVSQITDTNDPNYGMIFVDKVFADPLTSPGATILDDSEPDGLYLQDSHVVPSDTVMIQSNKWVLDFSKLAPALTSKLRLGVSGKGYMPRLILVSFNDSYYELLNHSWVFRVMSAR